MGRREAGGGRPGAENVSPAPRATTAGDPVAPVAPPLNPTCQKLLDDLRKKCPDIPAVQVPPGVVVQEVTRAEADAQRDLVALLTAGGTRPKVVWRDSGSEVEAHLDLTRIQTLPHGLVLVGITLETVETQRRELTVPFALGHAQRLAGMLATTERKPRGDEVLVDRWGAAVIATAWKGLLDLATTYAALAGNDVDGNPLVAAAIVSEPPRLIVVPRARFDFENPKAPAAPPPAPATGAATGGVRQGAA